MKKIISLISMLLSFSAMAEGFNFKIETVEGDVIAHHIVPEQAQVVMRCQFVKNGVPTRYSEKRPPTTLKIIEQKGDITFAKIKVKGYAVNDYLPGFKRHNCSLSLIFMGRNFSTRGIMVADFVHLGQLRGQMNEDELDKLTDTTYATETLKSLWNPLEIEISKNGNIVLKE